MTDAEYAAYCDAFRTPQWVMNKVRAILMTTPKHSSEHDYGWICPLCGCANAPDVKRCPCRTPTQP